MADKSDLNEAFKELRSKGYFARQNFWCCQNCAWSAIVNDERAIKKYDKVGVVFYHAQDAQALRKMGKTYLAWKGNGDEIVRVLESHGLTTKWNGETSDRIHISF